MSTEEVAGEEGSEAGEGSEVLEDPGAEASGASEVVEDEMLPPLLPVLEAVLFASAEPLPLSRLTRVLGAWTKAQIATALGELGESRQNDASGIRLVETAGGYQLRSAIEYAAWVRKFFTEKPPRLSRAVLETLAVVAYRQPATRGEIEAVRGVNCDAVLGALTARGLITVLGRRQSPGRPAEYGTTREFLELFSLRDLSELPPLPDPAVLANLIEGANEDAEAESGEPDQIDEPNEIDESDGSSDGALAEDSEPGGDRLAESGGGADSGGAGPGEREGGPRAGGEG